MKIDLTTESDINPGLCIADLESIAKDISGKLEIIKPKATVEVFFVNDDKIRKLNKKYRHKNEVTDVLSFPQKNFSTGEQEVLGTIFIAPKFAKKESVESKELFIHGILHLLGFDHDINMMSWLNAEKKIERTTL